MFLSKKMGCKCFVWVFFSFFFVFFCCFCFFETLKSVVVCAFCTIFYTNLTWPASQLSAVVHRATSRHRSADLFLGFDSLIKHIHTCVNTLIKCNIEYLQLFNHKRNTQSKSPNPNVLSLRHRNWLTHINNFISNVDDCPTADLFIYFFYYYL